jgi:hypothetical protein
VDGAATTLLEDLESPDVDDPSLDSEVEPDVDPDAGSEGAEEPFDSFFPDEPEDAFESLR